MTGRGVTCATEWKETEEQGLTGSNSQPNHYKQHRSSSPRDPEINSG